MLGIIFWILAAVVLFSALSVVLLRNPIYCLLMLVVSFSGVAGFYFLLHAPFLGVVQLIVYAGAIMVLFLFTMMLMNLNQETEAPTHRFRFLISLLTVGLLFASMLLFVWSDWPALGQFSVMQGPLGTAKALGMTLFSNYLEPFELSSVLFLAAVVGVVMIGQTLQKKPKGQP